MLEMAPIWQQCPRPGMFVAFCIPLNNTMLLFELLADVSIFKGYPPSFKMASDGPLVRVSPSCLALLACSVSCSVSGHSNSHTTTPTMTTTPKPQQPQYALTAATTPALPQPQHHTLELHSNHHFGRSLPLPPRPGPPAGALLGVSPLTKQVGTG